LLIGTKALGTVETLPQGYLQLRERDLVPLAAGKKALKPLEAVPRALSLTSTSKTNLVSLWLIARQPLHAGVVGSLEAECKVAVLRRTTVVAGDQAVLPEEVSNREVEANEEVQGGGGEIGTRYTIYVSLYSAVIYLCSPRQNSRARESSVAINPSWHMLEEIEMLRLSKLRMEVEEPEDL
jgi:hypothetical protein